MGLLVSLLPACYGADNGWVIRVLELVIVVAIPTVAGYAIIAGLRGAHWSTERWHRRQYARRPDPESIDRLQARLRKLRAELDATETRSGVSAKHTRLTALRGAYVDVLCTACTRLDVAPPAAGERAPLAEIYRVEAALRQRGLDVREPAVH
jgi:hypothetical protein